VRAHVNCAFSSGARTWIVFTAVVRTCGLCFQRPCAHVNCVFAAVRLLLSPYGCRHLSGAFPAQLLGNLAAASTQQAQEGDEEQAEALAAAQQHMARLLEQLLGAQAPSVGQQQQQQQGGHEQQGQGQDDQR